MILQCAFSPDSATPLLGRRAERDFPTREAQAASDTVAAPQLVLVELFDRGRDLPPPRQPLMTRLAWAHLAGVQIVDRVPVDTRHNAKVDYPALRELLARPQRCVIS
jgi:hypothetical protein